MGHSWDIPEDQKKDLDERLRKTGAEFDPETGRRKGQAEDTGDTEDVEGNENIERNGRNRNDEDDNIR